ncbi:MAG: hypothetical protein ACYC5H_01965 [Methylovirgula sp.]
MCVSRVDRSGAGNMGRPGAFAFSSFAVFVLEFNDLHRVMASALYYVSLHCAVAIAATTQLQESKQRS